MGLSWNLMYPSLSGSLCLVGLGLLLRRPAAFSIASRSYCRFLCRPWKLLSFAVALALMILVAPYSGDPTWDHFDALSMSVLTFATAPWSVGTLARLPCFRPTLAQAVVALCLWLLSASLSYDLYLWLRDGFYPDTSQLNLLASSGLYIAAGLFWNLQHRGTRLFPLAFLDATWPAPVAPQPFRHILPHVVLLALLVAALLSPFFWNAFRVLAR